MDPEFVELVRRKIDDGKSLIKNLIVGKVRQQKIPSFGSIEKGDGRLSNKVKYSWRVGKWQRGARNDTKSGTMVRQSNQNGELTRTGEKTTRDEQA
jgi:hypothetical protein